MPGRSTREIGLTRRAGLVKIQASPSKSRTNNSHRRNLKLNSEVLLKRRVTLLELLGIGLLPPTSNMEGLQSRPLRLLLTPSRAPLEDFRQQLTSSETDSQVEEPRASLACRGSSRSWTTTCQVRSSPPSSRRQSETSEWT